MKVKKIKIIDEFYKKNGTQFTVPFYQRNYTWKKKNCEELYRDIYESQKNGVPHFLGTIVVNNRQSDVTIGDTKIERRTIIDGQQRLTSIYLLLKALYDLSESNETKNKLKSLIYNCFNDEEITSHDVIYKLKDIDKDDTESAIFKLLDCEKIEDIEPATKISDAYKNYNYFKNFTKKSAETEKISIEETIGLVIKGLSRLEAALIVLGSKDKAQVVFERINSTGVPLSLVDSVRNYLLMDSGSRPLYKKWESLEDELTSENKSYLGDFIWMYTIFKGPSIDDKDSYRSFKKIVNNDDFKGNNEAVLDDLLKYAKYYAFLSFDKSKYDENYSTKSKKIVKCYSILHQTTIYPFLFHVLDDFDRHIIKEKETLDKILSFFLNYLLRRAILKTSTSTLRTLFKGLYSNRIFPNNMDASILNDEGYLNRIYKGMAEIKTGTNVVPADNEKVKAALCSSEMDLYHYQKGSLCRFIFNVLENYNPSIEHVDCRNLEIEHIMPQNISGTVWENNIDSETHARNVGKFGNLSLCTKQCNSAYSNKPFSSKKEEYKNNQKCKNLYADVISDEITEWNEESINNRANKLSSKLIDEIFAFPDEFEKILQKERPELYDEFCCSLDEDINYTNINLISVTICENEPIPLDKMSLVMQKVCEYLLEEYPDIIDELARETPAKGKKTYFSYDSDASGFRQPHELSDSGIYIDTHSDNNGTVESIVKILDYFDEVNAEDISVTFKRKNSNK